MTTFEELKERIYQEKNGTYAVWIAGEGGKRKRIRRKTREKLEAAIMDFLRAQGELEEDKAASVREVFETYCSDRLKYVSESTVTRDKSYYERHIGGTGFEKQIMSKTTAEMWTRFLQAELAKSLTAKQWAGLRAITCGLLHYCEDTDIISGFTAEDVFKKNRIHKGQFTRAQKVKTPENQVFTDDEMAKIKQYCRENPDQYNRGILLLFATGMRVGELVCLKAADIRPDTLQVNIHRTETQYYEPGTRHKVTAPKDRPKTDAGIRLVSVSETEIKLLQDIKEQALKQPWAFCRLHRGRYIRINAQGIRKRLYRICTALGIDRKSPHKIRKTYASILLDNHVDDAFTRGQMGHASISTTEKDYHKNRKSAAKKAEILSQIPEIND